MILQDPEDVDPDQWLDEGELRSPEPSVDWRDPEIPPEPELEIQVIPEDPVREGVHERIQAEIHHEDKDAEAMAEKMLEVSPKWNEVPDLMMEDKGVRPGTEGASNRKIDELALRGGENSGMKMISALKNVYIPPQCPGGQEIQRDSTLKM